MHTLALSLQSSLIGMVHTTPCSDVYMLSRTAIIRNMVSLSSPNEQQVALTDVAPGLVFRQGPNRLVFNSAQGLHGIDMPLNCLPHD